MENCLGVKQNGNDCWADLPTTPDEEAQIAESIEDFIKGECLTLEELIEGL